MERLTLDYRYFFLHIVDISVLTGGEEMEVPGKNKRLTLSHS